MEYHTPAPWRVGLAEVDNLNVYRVQIESSDPNKCAIAYTWAPLGQDKAINELRKRTALANAQLIGRASATKDMLQRIVTAYFNGEEHAFNKFMHEADDFLAEVSA